MGITKKKKKHTHTYKQTIKQKCAGITNQQAET